MAQDQFVVTFRGVRGSIPTPMTSAQIEEKLEKALELAKPSDLADTASRKAFIDSLPIEINGCLGGNSSCIQVDVNGEHLIFDGGSGIRELGLEWMNCEFGKGQGKGHIFFSHTHWDHILGIPFFTPLYIKGNQFTIHSAHENIADRLNRQQHPDFFPVPFNAFSADINFNDLEGKSEVDINSARITWQEMYHPGKSYAFRVDYRGKSVVYATDAEYKRLGEDDLKPAIDFFRDADVLIFDAQYTFSEGLEKEDWGHSSTFIGIDLAVEAGVKKICFHHHEPNYSDFKLVDIFRQTQKYLKLVGGDSPIKICLAHEGMKLDLFND